MAYLLRFHPVFILELDAAILYYSGLSEDIGERFKLAAKKQLNILKRNPFLKSVRYDDVRFARIERFPYAIHYSIDTVNKWVLSIILLSDQQNPDLRRKRWQ